MKIGAYAISKNEERNVQNFLRTVAGFDDVVVVDTGSTDNTVSLLRKAGIRVFEKQFDPFDFSKARNFSLSCVVPDIEWCFSLDFNEYFLTPDWRDLFEEALTKDASMMHVIRYDNDNGVISDGLERKAILHKKDAYAWVNAVHEILVPHKNVVPVVLESDIKLAKKVYRSQSRDDFYLSICVREYERNPGNSFYLWFIVLYFYNRKEWTRVIHYAQKYLEITASCPTDHRVFVLLKISRSHHALGLRDGSVRYGLEALSGALTFRGLVVFERTLKYLLNLSAELEDTWLFLYVLSFVEHPTAEMLDQRQRLLKALSAGI